MAPRALVIAIERYRQAIGLVATTLPGTHLAAREFVEWLTRERGVASQNIWVNTDDDAFPAAAGRLRIASGQAIRDSIAELVDDGAGSTEQLFVFFSGHGCSGEELDPRYNITEVTDLLVASGVRAIDSSAIELISVAELWKMLQVWLGPGEHYYFLDACRNEVGAVPHHSLGFRRSRVLGNPAVYRMSSTGRGTVAATASGFVDFLVDGLRGRGRAKHWRGDRLGVYFESLFKYVAGLMKEGQSVEPAIADPRPDAGPIVWIDPAPTVVARIKAEGVAPDQAVELTAVSDRGRVVVPMVGPVTQFELPPGDYTMWISTGIQDLEPVPPGQVDLYESRQVRLVPSTPAALRPDPEVHYATWPGVEARLITRNGFDREIGLEPMQVRPGRYEVQLRDARGRELQHFDLNLRSGDRVAIDNEAARSPDRLRTVILDQLPSYAKTPGTVEFSGTIGPLMDDDIAVWLAILGASRIVAPPEQFSKIGRLPLFHVEAIRPEMSAITILTAADEHPVYLQVWPDGIRTPAQPVPSMPGFTQFVTSTSPGPKIVGIAVGDRTRSILVHCMPNRATLLVATGPPSGAEIKQFVLPMHHLTDHLHPRVAARVRNGSPPLDWVRYSAQAQRSFAAHLPIARDGSDMNFWYGSLFGKWVDPVIGILAAYELVRRADPEHSLNSAIYNIRHYYPQFGDGDYLAHVVGIGSPRLGAFPIVAEAWAGLGGPTTERLSDIALDFDSPWVSWADHDPEEIGQRIRDLLLV